MPTPFTKQNLIHDGMYIHYTASGSRWDTSNKFIARFKHSRDGLGSFMAFLRKNFTVEEYFARLDAGETPLGIVQSKGYIAPHIKKWLKRYGYPVTPEGYQQFLQDQVARLSA